MHCKKARADTSRHPEPTDVAATSATVAGGSGPGQREAHSDSVSLPPKDTTGVASASAVIGDNMVVELGPVGGEGDVAAQRGTAPVVFGAAAAQPDITPTALSAPPLTWPMMAQTTSASNPPPTAFVAPRRELVVCQPAPAPRMSSTERFWLDFTGEAADASSSSTLASEGTIDITPAATQGRMTAVHDSVKEFA